MNGRFPKGRLQQMSCRRALAKLNRCGALDLPRQEESYAFQRRGENSRVGEAIEAHIAELSCPFCEVGEVTVDPVTSRYSKESKIWFALLDRYHYLGSGHLCGAQIRYVVKSETHGYLGALAFSSASWALKQRDEHIGWTEPARRAHLRDL